MFSICAPVYVLQGCETVRSTAIPGKAQNGAQLRGLIMDCASVSPGFAVPLGWTPLVAPPGNMLLLRNSSFSTG